ncbi:MAG TPA: YceD family protein [Beijerinckia sp.]|jgi:hypothetical protein|nr:YceD family protein [Beijerinckia sp.]
MKLNARQGKGNSGKVEPVKSASPHFRLAGRELGVFSREIKVDDVPEAGLDVTIAADAAECVSIALQVGLVAVASLTADFHVEREGRGTFNVKGTLCAEVTQTCVITLDLFDSEISTEIDVDFVRVEDLTAHARAGRFDPFTAEQEMPDPIIDGKIDLGALAAEFLVLGLDPYPKKPGAQFEAIAPEQGFADKVSPFAVLRKLEDES